MGWLISDVQINLFLARISILEISTLLFFLFFVYSISGDELALKKKILFAVPFLPFLIFLFTDANAYMADPSVCETRNGNLYIYLYIIAASYIGLAIKKISSYYFKKETSPNVKSQIKIIVSGVIFVVFWFIFLLRFTAISLQNNYPWGDQVFLFAPFGMLVFMALLAYAITKYQFLKIKLIAAQALTYAIWILIASQYFFAAGAIMYLLISLTLLLSILFGIFLIKSVKEEVERKEELQIMADKLANANDALRKLDNAKTEFISIASHQLRTPITAIKGFASLLLEGSYGELSEGVKGALEKVYASSERLVNLIEDLLNVSRIESGRMQFAFEKASVEKLIKELYDNFILIAKTKKFYLDIKLPEVSLPEIMMDYSKIRELVSNFIDNALKYTEKGGATVKAELRDEGVVIDENGFVIEGKKSEFGKMIRITVSDTGIGIPREEIPYLFKKFSRGKDVSRLHVGGTGLGLYVGKAIAEAHHGQVWVESDGAGLGSRFIIEIPVEHVA
jgi:signal transduction histidine kinase